MLGAKPRPGRQWPSLAKHTPESLKMAADPLVQEAITLYMGHGRSIPAVIIDAGLARELFAMTRKAAPELAVANFRAQPGDRYRRAILRAVHHNIWLMSNGLGGPLWEG